MGFDEIDGIVTVMISLIFSVLFLFMIGAIIAARRVAKIPQIRLVSTNQPPELTIVLGLTWHLFNSHIWSVIAWREKRNQKRHNHPQPCGFR